MKNVRRMHIALSSVLAITIGLNALTPVKRGAIQQLTKEINAGLNEAEARRRAIALKIDRRDMKDNIVTELIMSADVKGMPDIFDATLVTQRKTATGLTPSQLKQAQRTAQPPISESNVIK